MSRAGGSTPALLPLSSRSDDSASERLARIAALSLLILLALLLVTVGFWAAALLAATVPAARRAATAVIVALSAGCLVAGVTGLVRGGAATLPLPVGLPGLSVVFALDPVSLAFLPAIGLAGGAAALTVASEEAGRLGALMGLAVLLLCAGDAASLVIAAGLAVFVAGPGRGARAAWVSLGLAAGLAVLLPHAGLLQSQSLPALRTEALAGAGRMLTVPLALGPVMLLLAGAGLQTGGTIEPVLGGFLAARMMFDLPGPSAPFATGLLVTGAALAAACRCGLAAVRGETLQAVGGGLAGSTAFVALTGCGIGLTARAADLPAIASASLAGALMLVLLLSVAVPLLSVAVASIVEQAGSRRLGALGGLAGPMRQTTLAAACAMAVLAAVPPLAGFAPLWLLLQALLSAQRFGALATPILLALVLAGLGLAVGLGFVAALRLFTIVFLGRPRTPRGAAAAEARAPMLRVMAGLAALLLAASAVPGLVLRLFDPVAGALTGSALAGRAGPFAIHLAAGGAWWSPLPVLLLAAPVGALAWWARRSGPAVDPAPAWDGGAAPPPEWLPFGEPLAQAGASGLASSVLEALGFAAASGRGKWAVGRGAVAAVVRRSLVMSRRLVRMDRTMTVLAPALLTGAVALTLLWAVLRPALGRGPLG